MSLRAIMLVALVAGPAAFAGGLFQGQHPSVDAPKTRMRPPNAPIIARPGEHVAEAATYMAALNAPPPPPPPPPRPKPTPPPPPPAPPDVAVLFRQEFSAVLDQLGGQPKVVLASASGARRTLVPGQVYRDGWTLSGVTATSAVLTKGEERRSIGLTSPPPASTLAAGPTQPNLVQNLALTNGQRPGQISPAQLATIVAALRSSGMNDRQVESMRTVLTSGQVNQQLAMQLIQQVARSPQSNPAAINSMINAFSQAGVIPAAQARQLSETMPQMQQLQQVQQVLQNNGGNNNRGGGGGNNNNGGRGGRGGFNGPPNAGFGGAPPAPPARPAGR